MHPTELPRLNRRGFLKMGLVGSGILMSAGVLGSLHGCSAHQSTSDPHHTFKVLRSKDAIIMSAIAPVVLKGSFPTEPEQRQQALDRLLRNMDEFFLHSSEFAHHGFAQLFDMLYMAPARILMTGVWSRWENASEDDINQFLTRWRDSSFNMFRMGFAQLTQLTSLVHYIDPHTWNDAMYPGPPQHIPS